jgi:hypothetical protein
VDVRSLNDEQASEQGMARWGGPLALLVSVLGILVVGATTARLVPGDVWFAHPGDHHIYRWMAENGPIDFHVAPWGWRPTVPWLALALPIGIKAGFQLVTSVCLIVTASLMYVVGRGFGFQRAEALAGVVLFLGLGYAVRFNLYDFWLPDATAFLFVALAVVLIQRRADPSLALCLAVGVAAKESVLLVVGLCYGLRADRPFDVQTAKRAALVALPALAVLAAIRLGIDPHNGDPGYLRSFPDVIWLNAKRLPSYSFSPVLSETLSARVTALAPTVTKALSAFGLLIGGLAVVGAATRRQLALRFAHFSRWSSLSCSSPVIRNASSCSPSRPSSFWHSPEASVCADGRGSARSGFCWLRSPSWHFPSPPATTSGSPNRWCRPPSWPSPSSHFGAADTGDGPPSYLVSRTPQPASSSSDLTVKNQSRYSRCPCTWSAR